MAKRNPQQEQAHQREAREKIRERASQRQAEFHARQEHESLQAQAKMTAMPIHHEHAAGIDVVGVSVRPVGCVRRVGRVIFDNASGKRCFADGWRRGYVPSEG